MGDHEKTLLDVYGVGSRDEQWNCPDCGRALYQGNPAIGTTPRRALGRTFAAGNSPALTSTCSVSSATNASAATSFPLLGLGT